MFREMRRCKQALDAATCEEILRKATSGVLAVQGDDGYPYAVPLSYVFVEGKLIFHCAKEGHKLDAIKRCNKASFCVIEQDVVVPETYTTHFRSVITFGRIHIIEGAAEMVAAAEQLALKYAPDESAQSRNNEIQGALNRLCMLEMTIEHLSGKEAIELVKMRKQQP